MQKKNGGCCVLVMRSTKRKYFGAGKMVAKTKSKNLYIADKKKVILKKEKEILINTTFIILRISINIISRT